VAPVATTADGGKAKARRRPHARSESGQGVDRSEVHPCGFRLVPQDGGALVFDRDYAKLLHEDLALRGDLKTRFQRRRLEIEADAQPTSEDRHLPEPPSIIIGRKGTEVDN
jgi:hypothetical protein